MFTHIRPTKLHVRSSNISLVTDVKQRATHGFRAIAILLYTLRTETTHAYQTSITAYSSRQHIRTSVLRRSQVTNSQDLLIHITRSKKLNALVLWWSHEVSYTSISFFIRCCGQIQLLCINYQLAVTAMHEQSSSRWLQVKYLHFPNFGAARLFKKTRCTAWK
jgi:hypothetical protein